MLGSLGSIDAEVVVKSVLLFPRVPRDLYRPPLLPLELACWFVSCCLSWCCPPPLALTLTLDARAGCGGVVEFNPGHGSAMNETDLWDLMLCESWMLRLKAEEECCVDYAWRRCTKLEL